jgi:hypothetical protein
MVAVWHWHVFVTLGAVKGLVPLVRVGTSRELALWRLTMNVAFAAWGAVSKVWMADWGAAFVCGLGRRRSRASRVLAGSFLSLAWIRRGEDMGVLGGPWLDGVAWVETPGQRLSEPSKSRRTRPSCPPFLATSQGVTHPLFLCRRVLCLWHRDPKPYRRMAMRNGNEEWRCEIKVRFELMKWYFICSWKKLTVCTVAGVKTEVILHVVNVVC